MKEKNNTNNMFIQGVVKRVLNDKSENNKNKMECDYYPKLIKQYKMFLLWLNQTTIWNQIGYFKKKRASTYVTASVTASVPTENTVTASVMTDNTVSVSVPTHYPVHDSNFASIQKGRQQKGNKNENKIGT